MSNSQQNINKTQKLIEVSSISSDSPQSEQEFYAPGVQTSKKQQKNDQITHQNQNSGNGIEINQERQNRVNQDNYDQSRKKKNNKRNKKNLNEGDQMIKKQTKKRGAAPPELLTQSSKQNSSSCRSKSSQKVEVAAPEQPKQSRRLYIGNLPSEVSESQIRKLFKKYGNLKQVKLAINTTTGKSKGFAFVEYNEMHSAIKSKEELSSHILGGLKMIIQFCNHE